MPDTLEGLPFWCISFDEDGHLTNADGAAIAQQINAKNLTDLFVFSHGWNNDRATAMILYTGFFKQMAGILSDATVTKSPGLNAGLAGIFWPSILFPGDNLPTGEGGAASLDETQNQGTLASELPKVFSKPEQQQTLADLLKMLEETQPDNETLYRFRDKLSSLLEQRNATGDTTTTADNLGYQAATVKDNDSWMRVLDAFSLQPAGDGSDGGGAADLGSFFGRLWNGATNVLRVATYWHMKNRAGVVGVHGLGPLIGDIHAAAPKLRIHLLGHSFGARLVSYALKGLPPSVFTGPNPYPVKSLFLIQGAFSHFAFASSLPFDPGRAGDLAGMSSRVDGPLLTTHSLFDLAVGNAYPAASILAGQDAAATADLMYRWEGMGHDGAQGVDAASEGLGDVKTAYPFESKKWLNLDGNQIITNGGPPSGAHSDIIHPEIAWAALAASKVVQAS